MTTAPPDCAHLTVNIRMYDGNQGFKWLATTPNPRQRTKCHLFTLTGTLVSLPLTCKDRSLLEPTALALTCELGTPFSCTNSTGRPTTNFPKRLSWEDDTHSLRGERIRWEGARCGTFRSIYPPWRERVRGAPGDNVCACSPQSRLVTKSEMLVALKKRVVPQLL